LLNVRRQVARWRLLTDDVYRDRFAWLTNGQVGSDGLAPHVDLMPQFPYLGVPNA
jgi:hypothetical protein